MVDASLQGEVGERGREGSNKVPNRLNNAEKVRRVREGRRGSHECIHFQT